MLLLDAARLPVDWGKPAHRRLVRRALEPLAAADRGRAFELAGGALVLVWRGTAAAARRETERQLQVLFDAPAGTHAPLTELLLLPDDADRLLQLAAESLDAAARARRPTGQARPPLDGAGLARLERAIIGADMARFVRCRPVCEVDRDGSRLRWEQRAFDLDELAGELNPDQELGAAPWLARRLSESLDRRMLSLLSSSDELAQAGPFAVALSVASLVGTDFRRFDVALPSRLRGRVQIDLAASDVLADPSGFLFARDFARCRGFQLGLVGLGADMLRVLPPARTGIEVAYLDWSPQLEALPTEALAQAVGTTTPVLCQAGTPAALAWGRLRGIRLFQGRMAAPSPD